LTLFLRKAGAPLDNNIAEKGFEAGDSASQLCSLQNYAQSDSGVGPSTLNRPDLSGRPGFR
jgi:hypothetical protein